MNFTPQQVSDACREYGPQVAPLPANIDGRQLLWALSENESSHGVNCGPRYEPGFDDPDNPVMAPLLKQFGKDAASSFGPWQIMFVNAHGLDTSIVPSDFDDLDRAAQATIAFLNARLRRYTPQTVPLIGAIWNSGSLINKDKPGVKAYSDKLLTAYSCHPLLPPSVLVETTPAIIDAAVQEANIV